MSRGRILGAMGGFLTLLVLAFLFLPLAIVVLFSFNSAKSLSLPLAGLSLRWWEQVLSESEFITALTNSLTVAVATTLTTATLVSVAAYSLLRAKGRVAKGLDATIMATITIPPLLLGVGLLTTFSLLKIESSLFTVWLAHVAFLLPLSYLFARIAVSRLDPAIEESVADLGGNGFQVFRLAVLPQIWPALLGASLITFMLSMDEFLITNFVIGSEQTVPIYVFSRISRTIEPTINVISSLFMFGTLLTVALVSSLLWVTNLRRGRAASRELEEVA